MRHTKTSAEEWNARFPVGTVVRFWPVLPSRNDFPPVDSVTRSESWALGDGTPVVLIKGKSGGVWLAHIDTLDENGKEVGDG